MGMERIGLTANKSSSAGVEGRSDLGVAEVGGCGRGRWRRRRWGAAGVVGGWGAAGVVGAIRQRRPEEKKSAPPARNARRSERF
jgi:hypothetical protein